VVAALFFVSRRLETWLHQHIFKVGWLVTKNYQTTTILYYTLLLPGVVLYELVYWLAAGFLNVRAESSIKWPEEQQIGALELNFVTLAKNTSQLKRAVITAAPLAAGLLLIWLISNRIFDLETFFTTISTGTIPDVVTGLRALTQAPDFWLWFYIAFTVANTMTSDWDTLTGIRPVVAGLVIATVILTALGLADEVVLGVLTGPVAGGLNALSGVLGFIIAIDLFSVGLLSLVENVIERITGDSAEFENGKMVTMTREERLSQRMKVIEKQRQSRQQRRTSQATTAGPPSLYDLPLPLPGDPGEVQVTPIQTLLIEKEKLPRLGERPARAGVDLITDGLVPDAPDSHPDQHPESSNPPQAQLPAPKSERDSE
jgi:hypothetical protein